MQTWLISGQSVRYPSNALAFILLHITPFKTFYLLSVELNPRAASVDALYFMFEELQYGGIQ